MTDSAEGPLEWLQGLRMLARAWKPLLAYELAMSLLSAVVLSPLVLTVSWALVGISGDSVLVNWDIVQFLISPSGAISLLLGLSLTLALLFVEYSGLVLIADGVLCGVALPIQTIVAWIFKAAPRLFGLAILQSALAILAMLPFLGVAALAYWYLLSESDINYYLAERPPRFWVAGAIGIALSIGGTTAFAWFFAQWAFAVPLCVLTGEKWSAALRGSARLVRGRAWRLLLAIAGWRLLEDGTLVVALMGLDRGNEILLARFDGQRTAQLWSTAFVLLLDAVVLQLIAAMFAVALAAWIAYQYENARRSSPSVRSAFSADQRISRPPSPAWRTRAAIVALALLGPAASIGYALVLKHELVELRPIKVTGHRAGSKLAPENSLAALRLSIAAVADFVEIDVQQTADGHVVLLHDRDLRRVTGDPRQLRDVRLADLESLRLIESGNPTDEWIPTLVEFLSACEGKIRVNIELKDYGHSPGLAKAVLGVLRDLDFVDHAMVSCFDMPPLAELRQLEPRLRVGAILSTATGDTARLPVDFLSLNHRLVNAGVVHRAHRRGMEVHAWTVNDPDTALRLLDLGCDNLITSDPALMRETADWYVGLGDSERMLLRLRRWMRE